MRGGAVTLSELDARELGIELCALSDLAGGEPQRNAEIALAMLGGEEARARATALNAAAAIVVGGARGRSRRRFGQAREALRSGAANGDVVGAARRGEGSARALEGIGAWTRERLEERRETRSLAAALLAPARSR